MPVPLSLPSCSYLSIFHHDVHSIVIIVAIVVIIIVIIVCLIVVLGGWVKQAG